MDGKLITFEGIDGSGKSTQIRMLSGELLSRGFEVLNTREPGGTPLGRRLREAFLETEEEVDPLAELLLFAADRAQHVNFLIKPALAEGKIVLSDRYADATYAYQGAGRGFPEGTVNTVIELATGGLKPDLTIFFDLPVEKSLSRAGTRGQNAKNNRMDLETADFYGRVRKAYLGIAEQERHRFIVVNGDSSIEKIQAEVVKIVVDFLNKKEVQAAK